MATAAKSGTLSGKVTLVAGATRGVDPLLF
jgi:hypothetical protein